MNKRIIQIKLVILAVMTLFLYNQCGNPYQSQPTELQFTDNSVSSSSFETEGSLQAFEDSVYQVTTARCATCHTTQNPTHAHADSQIAHDDVVDQFKVNFANIPSSRLVAKIRDENHGCWSGDCVADSQEMEDAVQYWADKVAEVEEENNNNNNGNTTGDNGNNGGTTGNTGGTGYMEEVESVDVFKETVYPITRQRCVGCHNNLSPRHAHNDVVQAHNAVVDNGLVNFNNINASRLVQRLSVDAHQCWNGNCAANAVEMAAAIQTWKDIMAAANNTGGNTNTDPLTTNESGLSPGEALLTYDLSGMLNVNEQITFQIKVMIYDDYSYKFWDPEIITASSNVQVQNIQLLINGYYNPQHSAYTIVNSTVTPGNGSLASHALLALKDQGEAIDKISFKFGVLQISN